MNGEALASKVDKEVTLWLEWLPRWKPQTHRGKTRVCKKCTGSPITQAAGFRTDTPHQVVHALVSRMHKLIDKEVDDFVSLHLPVLRAELDGMALWKSGKYDPRANLPAEVAAEELDFIEETGDHPVLFTFAELEESSEADPVLPMPPLNAAEKQQLVREIQLSDNKSGQVGRELCFLLAVHSKEIRTAVDRFVEPQIQDLLSELSKNLESPSF